MVETKIHLTEEIVGNKAVCYHRTRLNPDKYPTAKNPITGKLLPHYKPTWQDVARYEPILQAWSHTGPNWGFHTGGGDFYGPGMYSTFRDPRTNTQTKGYGQLILKFGISNISNYLFIDFKEFQKTPKYKENPKAYTQDTYIIQQMLDAGVPLKLIASLESKCSLSNSSGDQIVEKYGRPQFAWKFSPYFLGFIYTGGHNDGDVLVTFDPAMIIKKYGQTQTFDDTELMSKEDIDEENNRIKAALKLRKNNIQTIYPLSFSIDDGNTYHPIQLCEPIKEKIIEYSNNCNYSQIMTAKGKSNIAKNPTAILEAYTIDGKFNIPFLLTRVNIISEQAVIDYISSRKLDLVVSELGSPEYYNLVSRIIDAIHLQGIIVNITSTIFDERKIDQSFLDVVAKVNKIYIEPKGMGSMPFYVEKAESPLPFLMNKNISRFKEIDKLLIGPGALDQFATANIKARLVIVDISEQNLAAAQSYFKGAKVLISQSVLGTFSDYRDDLTSLNVDGILRKVLRSMGSNSYERIVGFANGKTLKVKTESAFDKLKYWEGTVEYLPTLYYDSCQLESYKYLKSKSNKLILNKVIVSPVKDKIVSRTISEFPADDTTGIRNLSVIGKINIMGDGITGVMRLGCDITAFNCLKNNIKVFEYLAVYLPDQGDEKFTVTPELIDDLKRVSTSNTAIFIYSRGTDNLDGSGDQIDFSQLDTNLAYWVKQHRLPYNPKIFSKYIDIQKDLSDGSSEIKTVQKLPDDELLDEVAAEAED